MNGSTNPRVRRLARGWLLALLLVALPVGLASGQAEDWGWDEPAGNALSAERPVLVLLASGGGDLSAVAADSLAGHPRLRRHFRVLRSEPTRRGERGAAEIDILLTVSAAQLEARRDNRQVVLVISQVDVASREVQLVRRMVATTFEQVIAHADDLSAHIPAIRQQILREPEWFREVAHDPEAFVGVGRGLSGDQARAMLEAQNAARRSVEAAVAETAAEVVRRFFARRNQVWQAPAGISLRGSLERLNLARSEVLTWRDNQFVVYTELKTPVRDARRAFLETARHLAGTNANLGERELYIMLDAYMRDPSAEDDGAGYNPDADQDDNADEAQPQPRWPEFTSVEVVEQDDRGAWVHVTVNVQGAALRESTHLALMRAGYEVLAERHQANWGQIRDHPAVLATLERNSRTRVEQVPSVMRQRPARIQVQIEVDTWRRWVERMN